MSQTELEHLIKMINQIADNISVADAEAVRVQAVAGHVRKFWAPSMRQTLLDYAQQDEQELQSIARKALHLLAQEAQA